MRKCHLDDVASRFTFFSLFTFRFSLSSPLGKLEGGKEEIQVNEMLLHLPNGFVVYVVRLGSGCVTFPFH